MAPSDPPSDNLCQHITASESVRGKCMAHLCLGVFQFLLIELVVKRKHRNDHGKDDDADDDGERGDQERFK